MPQIRNILLILSPFGSAFDGDGKKVVMVSIFKFRGTDASYTYVFDTFNDRHQLLNCPY